MNLKIVLPQNQCFVRGVRQVSSHLTKCHACHGICTLSPLDAALTTRFVKTTQHDTPKVLRLPCKITMEVSKVLCLPRKIQGIFWKRFSTRYETCHAKGSYATLENSKSDPFCRTRHRHGHTGPARTVATPRPPEWNGNPCYAFGNKEADRISV